MGGSDGLAVVRSLDTHFCLWYTPAPGWRRPGAVFFASGSGLETQRQRLAPVQFMRMLVVSDEIEPHLYGPGAYKLHGSIDLLISCGDLPFYYLEYLASVLNAPIYYVFGNHGFETEQRADEIEPAQPRVGVNLDRAVVCERGVLLAGLEGCMRYNRHARFQASEWEMWRRVLGLTPRLALNRLRYGRFMDVLVTHAPPFGIHDQPDRAHQGFKSFLWLLRTFRPRYHVHGHIHLYDRNRTAATRYHRTDVINVFPRRIIEL